MAEIATRPGSAIASVSRPHELRACMRCALCFMALQCRACAPLQCWLNGGAMRLLGAPRDDCPHGKLAHFGRQVTIFCRGRGGGGPPVLILDATPERTGLWRRCAAPTGVGTKGKEVCRTARDSSGPLSDLQLPSKSFLIVVSSVSSSIISPYWQGLLARGPRSWPDLALVVFHGFLSFHLEKLGKFGHSRVGRGGGGPLCPLHFCDPGGNFRSVILSRMAIQCLCHSFSR